MIPIKCIRVHGRQLAIVLCGRSYPRASWKGSNGPLGKLCVRQAEIGCIMRHFAILNNDEKVVTFGDVGFIFHYPNANMLAPAEIERTLS